ncbi:MAG: cyclic nucleotide-binding domain-containing protein [Chloroflexota bacterium]|nr:cyclic nucleotide-binding domain-containing protein [Chloroflexota bacterium]
MRTNRLLRSISSKELEHLLARAHWLRCPMETVVVQQGSPVDAVLFLTEGRAAAVMEVPVPGSRDFWAFVHFLGPGADIGLLSLVDGAPHPATVTALGDVQAVAIPVDVLQHYLRSHPARYRALAQVAVENLRTYQKAFPHGWTRLEPGHVLC